MKTYYLRASGRDELVAACVAAGILTDDAQGTQPVSPPVVWDEIGPIYRPSDEAPIVNGDGAPYWHANLYADDAIETIDQLAAYLIAPVTPVRGVWV